MIEKIVKTKNLIRSTSTKLIILRSVIILLSISIFLSSCTTNLEKLIENNECPDCNLTGVKINGTDLHEANLKKARLERANLKNVNLSGANMWNADLSGADLSGANLDGADLGITNLTGANLEGASLKGANLEGATLRRIKLDGANLEGANLERVWLGYDRNHYKNFGVSQEISSLKGANLSGANLKGAFGLENVILTGVKVDKNTVFPNIRRNDFEEILRRSSLSAKEKEVVKNKVKKEQKNEDPSVVASSHLTQNQNEIFVRYNCTHIKNNKNNDELDLVELSNEVEDKEKCDKIKLSKIAASIDKNFVFSLYNSQFEEITTSKFWLGYGYTENIEGGFEPHEVAKFFNVIGAIVYNIKSPINSILLDREASTGTDMYMTNYAAGSKDHMKHSKKLENNIKYCINHVSNCLYFDPAVITYLVMKNSYGKDYYNQSRRGNRCNSKLFRYTHDSKRKSSLGELKDVKPYARITFHNANAFSCNYGRDYFLRVPGQNCGKGGAKKIENSCIVNEKLFKYPNMFMTNGSEYGRLIDNLVKYHYSKIWNIKSRTIVGRWSQMVEQYDSNYFLKKIKTETKKIKDKKVLAYINDYGKVVSKAIKRRKESLEGTKKEVANNKIKNEQKKKNPAVVRKKEIKLLASVYSSYIVAKKCFEVRRNHLVPYISKKTFEIYKNKTRIWFDYVKGKYPDLNTDEIWDDAVNTWNKSGVKQLLQTSRFDKNVRDICQLSAYSFTFHGYEDVFKEKLKKDF